MLGALVLTIALVAPCFIIGVHQTRAMNLTPLHNGERRVAQIHRHALFSTYLGDNGLDLNVATRLTQTLNTIRQDQNVTNNAALTAQHFANFVKDDQPNGAIYMQLFDTGVFEGLWWLATSST